MPDIDREKISLEISMLIAGELDAEASAGLMEKINASPELKAEYEESLAAWNALKDSLGSKPMNDRLDPESRKKVIDSAEGKKSLHSFLFSPNQSMISMICKVAALLFVSGVIGAVIFDLSRPKEQLREKTHPVSEAAKTDSISLKSRDAYAPAEKATLRTSMAKQEISVEEEKKAVSAIPSKLNAEKPAPPLKKDEMHQSAHIQKMTKDAPLASAPAASVADTSGKADVPGLVEQKEKNIAWNVAPVDKDSVLRNAVEGSRKRAVIASELTSGITMESNSEVIMNIVYRLNREKWKYADVKAFSAFLAKNDASIPESELRLDLKEGKLVVSRITKLQLEKLDRLMKDNALGIRK